MSGPVPLTKTAPEAGRLRSAFTALPPTSIGRLARSVFGAGDQAAAGTLLVTSVEPKAGVSWVAAGIASQLASDGRSVVLVDAISLRDLPQRTDVVTLCTAVGKGQAWVLGGKQTSSMPAPGSTSPTALFGHLTALSERFGCVVLDAPAMSESDTALEMASVSTASLLVARQDITERRRLERSGARLHDTGAKFLGYILNQYAGREGDKR